MRNERMKLDFLGELEQSVISNPQFTICNSQFSTKKDNQFQS
jgi:hypothetical protein